MLYGFQGLIYEQCQRWANTKARQKRLTWVAGRLDAGTRCMKSIQKRRQPVGHASLTNPRSWHLPL